jgi:hypothetical protein
MIQVSTSSLAIRMPRVALLGEAFCRKGDDSDMICLATASTLDLFLPDKNTSAPGVRQRRE